MNSNKRRRRQSQIKNSYLNFDKRRRRHSQVEIPPCEF